MHSYKVYVVGHIWWPNGMECASDYTFRARDDEEALNKIDRVAGDFSMITDFELYRGEQCPTCGQRVWECLREFSKDGEETYIQCMS